MKSLNTLTRSQELISVYDKDVFSDSDFQTELDAVHAYTEKERNWIAQANLQPYKTDNEILTEADAGRLVRVSEGVGFLAIQRLRDWDIERSDPTHEFYYSPPYLKPNAFEMLCDITSKWQSELGNSRYLSVTSLVRSTPYQQNLASKNRKLTITGDGMVSSHQVGLAFDIDGCGLVEEDDDGSRRAINPRSPGFRPLLVAESRLVLRHLLADRRTDGQINFVEELPGTQEHCFHVCVKP